jgi:hypothetical protein
VFLVPEAFLAALGMLFQYRLVPPKKGKKVQNRFPICWLDQISRAIAQKNGNLPLYLVPSMDYRNFSNFKSYRKN